MRVGKRLGCDLHLTTFVGEGLAGEGLLEDTDLRLEGLAAALHILTRHRELFRPVARAEDRPHAAAAQMVEYHQLLGNTDRVVEWEQHRGEQERYPLGRAHDRRGHGDRCRHPPVG